MEQPAGVGKWGRGLAGLVLAAGLALLTLACRLEPTFAPGTYMDRLQKRERIVIGVKYDIPRFGFLNPRTNEVEGFDVDLGKAIAKRLGVRAEFVEAISGNRIPFLQQDKVDLIISTMTIDEERKALINFFVPSSVGTGYVEGR